MAFLERNCPVPSPFDVSTEVADFFGLRMAHTKDEVLHLAGKAALVKVSHDRDTVTLLVRRPPTRMNVLYIGRVASLLNDSPRGALTRPWCVLWSFSGATQMCRIVWGFEDFALLGTFLFVGENRLIH